MAIFWVRSQVDSCVRAYMRACMRTGGACVSQTKLLRPVCSESERSRVEQRRYVLAEEKEKEKEEEKTEDEVGARPRMSGRTVEGYRGCFSLGGRFYTPRLSPFVFFRLPLNGHRIKSIQP